MGYTPPEARGVPRSGDLTARNIIGNVTLEPGEPFNRTLSLGTVPASVYVRGDRIWSSDTRQTERPHQIDKDFDKTSVEGLEIYARCLQGMGLYDLAEEYADSALAGNPSATGALVTKAALRYRAMDWEGCYSLSTSALNHAYDPGQHTGACGMELGQVYDA